MLIMGLYVIIIAYLTWDLRQVEGMYPPFMPEVAALDNGGGPLTGRQVFLERAKAVASDGARHEHFGRSIDIDGDTTVVGAPLAFPLSQGAAYVFTWSGNSWTQQAKLTGDNLDVSYLFGQSVAIEGDTIVVGALNGAGEAYVFTRSNDIWTQQSRLTADDGAYQDRFGTSVAIDGDTVIVGASFATVDANYAQGAAYVFTRSGNNWTQQVKLTADDGIESEHFGGSVAIDGDTAIVGAHLADVGANSGQGAVYVFTRSGSNWTQQAKLIAADGAASDRFGNSIAIYGDTIIVGATDADVGGIIDAGAAYIFTGSGSNWTQQAKLTPAGRDAFGLSVDIEGDTVIVGAPDTDIGCITYLGGIEGTAHIFTRSGNSWTPQNTLVASDRMVDLDPVFGSSVALSGNMAVVGTIYADVAGNEDQGAAYLYERTYFNDSIYLPLTIGTSFFCPDEE